MIVCRKKQTFICGLAFDHSLSVTLSVSFFSEISIWVLFSFLFFNFFFCFVSLCFCSGAYALQCTYCVRARVCARFFLRAHTSYMIMQCVWYIYIYIFRLLSCEFVNSHIGYFGIYYYEYAPRENEQWNRSRKA